MWYHVKCLGHDSTIKVSTELSVATRHRRDMTEKLLKVTFNPNKQQQEEMNINILGGNQDTCLPIIYRVMSNMS